MNDKLHDIARQAAGWAKKESTSPWSRPYGELYDEKFAELIVRECCQKLENDGMVEVAMEMKEHFGVEE